MAYDADGRLVFGERPGCRRPKLTEWDDPTGDALIPQEGEGVEVDVRRFRATESKEHNMAAKNTSPDLSIDDMSMGDLLGDFTPVDDDRLGEALLYAPQLTRRVDMVDNQRITLVEMPDELVDPASLVLELSTDWRVPTSAHVEHIDQELFSPGALIGMAFYLDTGERHAVKIGRVMTESGDERAVAAQYRIEERWTMTFWAYTTQRSPSDLLKSLKAIREADRSQAVEPHGLLGEKLLVSSFDTGETNSKGFEVFEVDSYRISGHTEDAVGTMRKLSRLVRTARARTSGLAVPDGEVEDSSKKATTPLPA